MILPRSHGLQPSGQGWAILSRLLMPLCLLVGGFALPGTVALWLLLGAYATANLGFLLVLRARPERSPWVDLWLWSLHLFEVLLAGVLMFLDSGLESEYGLFPILSATLAAYLFGPRGAVAVALATLGLFGVLALAHLGLFGADLLPALPMQLYFFRLVAVVGTAALVGFLVSFLSARLRQQEELVAGQARDLELVRLDLDAVLDRLTYGVLVVSPSGRILYFNSAAARLLRTPLLPGSELTPVLLAESWGGEVPGLLDEVRRGLRESVEAELRTAPGGWLRVQVASTQFEGRIRNLVLVLHDISHIRSMEQEVRNAERMSTLGHMAARIAHEIRNPLASITGSAELLGGSPDLADDDQKLLSLIRRESERLDRILMEFLDFSRPRTPSRREVGMGEILAEVRELVLARAAKMEHGELVVEIAEEDPGLSAHLDRDMVVQILTNLGINALQALPADRPGRIRLEARRDGGSLVLRVRDNGLGMPPEILDKMGEAFFTTRQGGVGLGVAISRQLCALLGGTFRVQSLEGRGTLVELAFAQTAIER